MFIIRNTSTKQRPESPTITLTVTLLPTVTLMHVNTSFIYTHARWVTIGDSGLCCCTVRVLRIWSARGELPRRPRSSLLYWCYVFWVLINSLLCWLWLSALGLVLFQIICMLNEWKKMYAWLKTTAIHVQFLFSQKENATSIECKRVFKLILTM